jgi:two-component system chemotaxis response regulator CheB
MLTSMHRPSEARGRRRPPALVALACSAGGYRPVRTILSGLPRGFPAPIIVAQHRGETSTEMLVSLLSARTALPVQAAAPLQSVRAGHIYICPPGCHVDLTDGRTLRAFHGPRIAFVRPSCDVLFSSMARELGAGAVCVVLSGTGSDGAMGTRDVRRAGGFVIAQDERSADHPGMPTAAVDLGRVDLVLPLHQIAFALRRVLGELCRPTSTIGVA